LQESEGKTQCQKLSGVIGVGQPMNCT
jgi:hypothetical protein